MTSFPKALSRSLTHDGFEAEQGNLWRVADPCVAHGPAGFRGQSRDHIEGELVRVPGVQGSPLLNAKVWPAALTICWCGSIASSAAILIQRPSIT
jgi:hypothetical protein